MGLPSNFYGGNNMKKTLSIVLSLLFMGIFSPAFSNTIKWSMPGDSLTLDPHAQNEGPTPVSYTHLTLPTMDSV